MTTTDIKQEENPAKECKEVHCTKDATMEIVTSVTFTGETEGIIDNVPYCDDHLGWFYRSFSRASYPDIEVLGINILLDCDTEIARMRNA